VARENGCGKACLKWYSLPESERHDEDRRRTRFRHCGPLSVRCSLPTQEGKLKMSTKVVAIVGSYRKGGMTDAAIEAILSGAREKGAETHAVYLRIRNWSSAPVAGSAPWRRARSAADAR